MNFSNSVWRVHAVGGIVAAGIVAAAVVLVVQPRLQAGAQARMAKETLLTVRTEAEQARGRAELAQKQATELQTELDNSRITLISAAHLNERVGQISDRAERLGLKILELVPGTEIDAGANLRFPVRLRAVGPAAAGPKLLGELHETFADLAVVGLTIRANPADAAESDQPAQAHLSIDFEWYAEREGAAPK